MDDGMQPVTRTIYLPAGTWYDFFTDERFEGPTFIERQVSIEEMPVFVRSGSVVPRVEVTPETRNTDDLLGQPWTVHVWGEVSQAAIDSLEGFDGPASIAEIVRHG